MPEPDRPFVLKLLSLGERIAHRATRGAVGTRDGGAAAPRGRALALITAVHRNVYRWTGGWIGGNAGGLPTLLLTTTGNKSGLPRTVPLPYFPWPDAGAGEQGWAVVASFAGSEKHPAWYTNIAAEPRVAVQIRRRRFEAVARPAAPAERPALWSQIVGVAPWYADYQKRTAREIPVVLLREHSCIL